MTPTPSLILASSSPRRQDLLEQLGISFEVRTSPIEENYPDSMKVDRVPEYLARRKANSIERYDFDAVLAADTVVICNEQILGKPADTHQAKSMLQFLSGRTHQVITGVCLLTQQHNHTFIETTHISFHTMTDATIDYYVREYHPFDKAGAYAIQEWIGLVGVKRIVGDYYNVVGLPVQKIWPYLQDLK